LGKEVEGGRAAAAVRGESSLPAQQLVGPGLTLFYRLAGRHSSRCWLKYHRQGTVRLSSRPLPRLADLLLRLQSRADEEGCHR
jgi:hypothetical protein